MNEELQKEVGLVVAQRAMLACALDATIPKPGNVSRLGDHKDTTLSMFLVSSIALLPTFIKASEWGWNGFNSGIAQTQENLGSLILEGIKETRDLWGISKNTNLGLVLFLVPFSIAAGSALRQGGNFPIVLKESLRKLLENSTVEDAFLVAKAIRRANPGGLGTVDKLDVTKNDLRDVLIEQNINLKRFFAQSREKDIICREYAEDFQITFEFILPKFERYYEKSCLEKAIIQVFIEILSHFPDSHIKRTKGTQIAELCSNKAREVLSEGGIYAKGGATRITNLDNDFRRNEINPGSTADLTAASIFIFLLKRYSEGLNELNLCQPNFSA